ncbi:MAG: triose-phosphate isomerase [Bacteroidales bacterium]
MRKNIVAGNWKMNTTVAEGVELAKGVSELLKDFTPNCQAIVGVPFTHLTSVAAEIDNCKVKLSAENCADKKAGAYTGEVSASMVASTGAEYVILGHSERRQFYGENEAILKDKTLLALENNLLPIFCIGEVLEQRDNGTYFDVVKKQIEESLFDLSAEDFGKIVLAYEPVWAIGTGVTATDDQAEEIHAYIRSLVEAKYGKEVAEDTSILYGGSCNPTNAEALFSKPNVDGGLIGGAALKADSFVAIIKAFK